MSRLFKKLINRLPADVVGQLKNTPQDPTHHPEGVVYKHIELVFDEVVKRFPKNTDMWVAAIFHDLGKIEKTTIEIVDGKKVIRAINHDIKSIDYYVFFRHLYNDLITDENLIAFIILQHMRMHKFNDGEMSDKKKNSLKEHKYFSYLDTFAKCDEMGKRSFFKRFFLFNKL